MSLPTAASAAIDETTNQMSATGSNSGYSSEADIIYTPAPSNSESDQDEDEDEDEDDDDELDFDLEDPDSINHHNFFDGAHKFHTELYDFLKKEIAGLPPSDLETRNSRAAFNAHLRSVFKQLREKAMADEAIPKELFTPPRSFVALKFCNWPIKGHYCCPCDLNVDNLPGIEIRAPAGKSVTKEFFIEKLGEALYGSDEQGNDETAGKIGGEMDYLIPNHVDYMKRDGLIGYLYVMCKGFETPLF